MVKMRSHLWVSVLFLVGCLLIFPYPVDSLDPPSVPCQQPARCFSEFLVELGTLDSGSLVTAKTKKLFHHLTTVYGETHWAQRARLRYGYALRILNPAEAIPLLHSSLIEFPVLDDFLHYWLFQAYVSAELWAEAEKVVVKFADGFHQSRFRADVLYEGGAVLSRTGDCQTARSVLSKALTVSPRHTNAAIALFQIGQCVGQLGQYEKQVDIFREMWWKFPLTQESIEAEQWLIQEIKPEFFPTIGERYQRAKNLLRRGAVSSAIKEFQQVMAVDKHTPHYFQAQYKLAKAWVRLKKYDQAEKALQILVRSSSSRKNDAWVWLARTYFRQGNGEALANLVKSMPLDHLTENQRAKIFTFYGIWLKDNERWAEAAQVYQKAAESTQRLSKQVEALWQVGWIQYQREQYVDAKNVFQDIIQKTNPPSSTSLIHTVSRASYWLARSEERMGENELAISHFRQISQTYPFTYYGQLAQSRLGVDGRTPQRRRVSNPTATILSPKVQQDVHYQKFQALQAVQLSVDAVHEFEQVVARHGEDTELFSQLVFLAGESKAYDIGIRLAIRHYGQNLRTGQLPRTSPVWSGAFPMGYQHVIQSFVPQHVDPFLVAGLIREESLYSARVVSPVGAIGLMQLMPATAKKVARQLNLVDLNYDADQLYQPRHNIQLGTHYLGQLIEEHQGNLMYSVAAYNAGPQAVKRWVAKYGHRPADEFVEFIGYRETRGYVKRVLGSYRIYRAFFGKTCPPISLDRFC